jgi:hypothetical protein
MKVVHVQACPADTSRRDWSTGVETDQCYARTENTATASVSGSEDSSEAGGDG